MVRTLMISMAVSWLALGTLANAQELDSDIFEAEAEAFDMRGSLRYVFCSGFLARFEDSLPTDKALGITNGHCVTPGVEPGTARKSRVAFGTYDVLAKNGVKFGKLAPTRLIYQTMQGTDISIHEFPETYEEIFEKFGIEPYTLSPFRAEIGDPVEVISSFFKTKWDCEIGTIYPEFEFLGFQFLDTIEYAQSPTCKTKPGTSGSQIVIPGTRTVVGINNAGARAEVESICEEAGDCYTSPDEFFNGEEEEEDDVYSARYGQQISDLYTCRGGKDVLDFDLEGCLLTKP